VALNRGLFPGGSYGSDVTSGVNFTGNTSVMTTLTEGRKRIYRMTGKTLCGEISYSLVPGVNLIFYSYFTGAYMNSAYLHPQYVLNERPWNFARFLTRFRWNRLTVQYIPHSSTATVASFSISYTNDGAQVGYTTNYLEALNNDPMQVTSVWRPAIMNCDKSLSHEWRYTDYETVGSDATNRQSFEGIVAFAAPNNFGFTDNTFYGYVVLHYEIDFSDPAYHYTDAFRGGERKRVPLVKPLERACIPTDRKEEESPPEPEPVVLGPQAVAPKSCPCPVTVAPLVRSSSSALPKLK